MLVVLDQKSGTKELRFTTKRDRSNNQKGMNQNTETRNKNEKYDSVFQVHKNLRKNHGSMILSERKTGQRLKMSGSLSSPRLIDHFTDVLLNKCPSCLVIVECFLPVVLSPVEPTCRGSRSVALLVFDLDEIGTTELGGVGKAFFGCLVITIHLEVCKGLLIGFETLEIILVPHRWTDPAHDAFPS